MGVSRGSALGSSTARCGRGWEEARFAISGRGRWGRVSR